MKKNLIFLSIIFIALSCTGCASNEVVTNCEYGFWGGLWHGIIAPFDFIGMLIWDDVVVYAPNNNGTWYAFGFLLGVSSFSFGLKS
jgi:hypothetical protein